MDEYIRVEVRNLLPFASICFHFRTLLPKTLDFPNFVHFSPKPLTDFRAYPLKVASTLTVSVGRFQPQKQGISEGVFLSVFPPQNRCFTAAHFGLIFMGTNSAIFR